MILFSCKLDEVSQNQNIVKFIHISHTRTDYEKQIDNEAKSIDYSEYDLTLLGGDLCLLTSENTEILNYVDSIFDLSNFKTLWTLGNHDYWDKEQKEQLDRIKMVTKRNNYYSYKYKNIVFLVIDTQEDYSNIYGEQLNYVDSVIENTTDAEIFILLHHKLIWMYNSELESKISKVSNANLGDELYCLNPNNFYEDIYPKLVNLRKKGTEVICLGGDIGVIANEFFYKTPDGIFFIASGIDWLSSEKKALIFEYDTIQNTLKWNYQELYKLQ